ncbi:hypothetical protein ACM66Z_09725 [Sulfurovum sp. ST-21]|uniref:DUF4149 domain-containing protein n=1 Tax=Sulfurovum indicum TaxID=2779528 RepID=A0A7M1S2L8_9BACT|nr:hypothetical protein [Sulfurovum indicum]QOR61693.1 hypothetical protein IMZ28_09710 [Sulfurovum indicum]
MIEQVIVSHSILVKAFLGFLAIGFFIPLMTAKNPLGFKKASFVYTMIFQALATMIAFTGLVAMVMGDFGITLSIIIMIIIWALLMYIEIKKYKLIKAANLENEETHQLLKSAFIKISAIQVMLVVMMVILKVMEVKGVISLS